MKTSKKITSIIILVSLILSCNDKRKEQTNQILETEKNSDKSKSTKDGKYDYLLIDIGDYDNAPTLEEFEYSNHWRKEAYKATKKYIQKEISKKPNCKTTSQGNYQPYLLRYLGNFGYLVKIYCEFDCNQNYNNPSYFWVEINYKGYNTWEGKVVKQKFVD
ncbi:hypothetical protein [Olleya sp. Hel_I_94]|uniref:hypothetical protein n=1 Tax=Olleya sp. Hel_I_94 TaxID=1250001 RepID=UPI0011A19A2D|nr:hypothetical protein [Olleya sp. Hel_I_94]TVZ48646.1 hypothetical protein JM82_3296 [Olleya sp. Hel_I_94]